jgi:outer membrane biosynthesis protein TonB
MSRSRNALTHEYAESNIFRFIKWRAALMELSVQELDLPSATEKIPEHGNDPYRMVQVHDYLNVSFLRMDPSVRAASKETIQTFSMAYPELLKEKFFVNVPLVMGWVFAAMKIFLSPDTIKKFHPLSYGSNLAGELKAFGQELPPVYGGKGKDVKEGLTVKYASVQAAEKKPAAVEAVEKEAAPVEAPKKKDAPAEAVEKEAAPVEAPKKKDAPAEAVEKEAAPVEAPKKKDAPAEAADKTDAPAEVAEKTDVAVEVTEQKDATVEVSA